MRILVLSVLLLLAAGCTSGLKRPVREVTATTDVNGVQHVRIVAHSFYFEPNRVIVTVHQPVELAIRNAAFLTPHNFSCIAPQAGLNVKKGLSWFGGTSHTRFIPTEPGEYPFFCSVDKHSGKGMTGTLVVR
jgi:plastocyanin